MVSHDIHSKIRRCSLVLFLLTTDDVLQVSSTPFERRILVDLAAHGRVLWLLAAVVLVALPRAVRAVMDSRSPLVRLRSTKPAQERQLRG